MRLTITFTLRVFFCFLFMYVGTKISVARLYMTMVHTYVHITCMRHTLIYNYCLLLSTFSGGGSLLNQVELFYWKENIIFYGKN